MSIGLLVLFFKLIMIIMIRNNCLWLPETLLSVIINVQILLRAIKTGSNLFLWEDDQIDRLR